MYYSALIGNPTEHSVSHILYEELIRAAGLNIIYKHIKIDVEADRLGQTIKALQELRFAGISVTLPYKLAVMEHLDSINPEAGALGAVNTIKIDDTLTGFNTDWKGIVEPVVRFSEIKVAEATIFGTGGAARAAVYACKKLGADRVNVLYRPDQGEANMDELFNRRQELGINMETYKAVAECVGKAQLVINATSCGMRGNNQLPFALDKLNEVDMRQKVYFDVVFNPLETPLLTYFRNKGAQGIDGLWMMIYQGVYALEIWLNKKITIESDRLDLIHEKLSAELGNV